MIQDLHATVDIGRVGRFCRDRNRDRLFDRIHAFARQLPGAAEKVRSGMAAQGIREPVLDRLVA